MTTVATIVEGDGEVLALPILLRRLEQRQGLAGATKVLQPIRVHRNKFLNQEKEFSRHLQLAAAKCGDAGWILVLLDADDDCPAQKGAEILAKAQAVVPHRRVALVLANREFEAWFIAAAPSLQGCCGFAYAEKNAPANPEIPRDAKGWMRAHMPASYGAMTDQPAFTKKFDLEMAYRNSRSFRKLCSEWDKHTAAP